MNKKKTILRETDLVIYYRNDESTVNMLELLLKKFNEIYLPNGKLVAINFSRD